MANKHILSDDEEADLDVYEATSAKRQRRHVDERDDGDDNDQDQRSSGLRKGVDSGDGDGDAMMEDVEEEDELDDDGEEEDPEQEQLNLKQIAQEMQSSGHRVAEAGVIRRVELHNFMCHSNTNVNFGPQVNFLVGVNGSGKSAVLTGITMALGGNAKATNRGQKGGDLIMEGKPSARVAVTLANEGEDAFQNHIYGKEITVERTLNKAGGGAYKIKNAEGKVVDTKKATLDQILDTFNIQVDNPMTVLTQDQSRQFLASSSAKDKYNFFMRGTQLAQLTEEYEQIRSNTETMEEVLVRKREAIPELKEAYRRAKDRAKNAQLAVDQQKTLQLLNDQVAWAYVDESEEAVTFGGAKIQEEKDKLAELEQERQAMLDELAVHEGKIADSNEAEAEAKSIIEQKLPRRDELVALRKANRDRVMERKDRERKMNNTIQRLNATIAEFDRQIADEERKLSRDLEAERRPLRENIRQAEDEIVGLTKQISDARQKMDEVAEKLGRDTQQYEYVKQQINGAEQMKADTRGRLEAIKRSQGNALAAYGDKMPRFLQVVNDTQWREKPVGPIGMYVKLNQPQYARVLESFFGATLNAFIVTNVEDQRTLKRLHRQGGLDHNVPILMSAYDRNFDYSNGEPDPNILTVLRACTISNDLVKQALIVSNRIEGAALVPTRPDGDTLLRTNPRNVYAAYSAECFQIRNNQGRSSSSTMMTWRGMPRLVRDVTAELHRVQEDLQRIQVDLEKMADDKEAITRQCTQWEQERRRAETVEREAQKRIAAQNRQIASWNAKLQEEQPNNIAALQENKRETEAERENAQAQYAAGMAQLDDQPGTQNSEEIVDELRSLEEQLKKKGRLIQHIQKIVIEEEGHKLKVQSRIDKNKKSCQSLETAIASHEAELEDVKKERDSRIEQATKICARPVVEKAKTRKQLEREIASITTAIKRQEKEQGATLDEILEQLAHRKKTCHEAVKSTNEIASLIKDKQLKSFDRLGEALSAAYDARISRWTDFRTHIATRAKYMFSHHLTQRGFRGKLNFKHDACTLDVLIQTEADTGKKKAKQKDTKSLSGGEKSFSTVCLLLTMWESVGCPLRCLDEFDVFMDAVNRRIAMKMMVETAAQADQTQFILITPQDMGGLSHSGDEVKIVKLADPSRASGALAHGR